MLSANKVKLSSLNATNEHSTLTLFAKSLSSLETAWSVDELGAHLEDFLNNILPASRKLPIAYFSSLSGVLERLMTECRRRGQLTSSQIRSLQFSLLQRIMKTPVGTCNLVPLLAAMRDMQLLSTAARDCIVEGFLARLTEETEAAEDEEIVSDLPIIFHHLLQLGDPKTILPVAQLWLSRGAKELADHLLFLAGQGSNVLDWLFKAAAAAAKNQTVLDPLTFALLLQSTRLPGVSLSGRASRQAVLRQFIAQLGEMHERHAQLRSSSWCMKQLSLPTPRDFLLHVARWLPDTEQSILAAVELAEGVKEAGWLEEMFCARPFARRELLRRAGGLFTDWPRLVEADAEIVAEFFPERVDSFAGGCFLGSEYALAALRAAPLQEALQQIKQAKTAESLPVPTVEDDDWTAIDDAAEAELIAALLVRAQPDNDPFLRDQLSGLCELLWLGRDACPLDGAVRGPLCALALDFASRQDNADEKRLSALLAAVDGCEVRLFASTAKVLLARGLRAEGPLLTAAIEAVDDWRLISDYSALPHTAHVFKALARLQIPFSDRSLQVFLWDAAERSVSQTASFTRALVSLLDSIKLCSGSSDTVLITRQSLNKLESVSDPSLIKALSRLLTAHGDAQVLDELVKAVIIHFGAVETDEKDPSPSTCPFGSLANLTTALRGSTLNASASEALFLSLIGHFSDQIGQLDWILRRRPELFVQDWPGFLRAMLPIEAIWKCCFALSTGPLAVAMQNMLASLYALGERLIEACPEPECLGELFRVLAVEVTRRVYLLLPFQEAGDSHSSSHSHRRSNSKKKLKADKSSSAASSTSAAASAASTLIFALERFEEKFLQRRVERWPQTLPRSTARDFKIVLENLDGK